MFPRSRRRIRLSISLLLAGILPAGCQLPQAEAPQYEQAASAAPLVISADAVHEHQPAPATREPLGPQEQICFGDRRLDGPADIAALDGCHRLEGALVLGGGLGSTQGLEQLRTVTGRLEVESGSALLSAEGFSGLRHLGGGLTVKYVHGLRTLELPSLETVDGSIDVWIVPQMTHLLLPALERVGGEVFIDLICNGPMQEIDLGQLRSVNESFEIRATCNQNLTHIWVDSLQAVGGDLNVYGAHYLRRLDFASLHFVGGDLSIRDHERLVVLGLDALTTVGGAVEIMWHPQLTAVHMPLLTSIPGALRLEHNDGLEVFVNTALTALGSLEIQDNAALELVTLTGLETIGRVEIAHNSGLISLDLPALHTADSILVSDEPELATLDMHALHELARLQLIGLSDLAGIWLGPVSELGYLAVEGCHGLDAIDFLPELELVTESVWLRGNDDVASITFPELAAVDHVLTIELHPSLHSLDVGALGFIGHAVSVSWNPTLAVCTDLKAQLTGALDESNSQCWSAFKDNAPLAQCSLQ